MTLVMTLLARDEIDVVDREAAQMLLDAPLGRGAAE